MGHKATLQIALGWRELTILLCDKDRAQFAPCRRRQCHAALWKFIGCIVAHATLIATC